MAYTSKTLLKVSVASVALGALLLCAAPALATDNGGDSEFDISANVGFVSEYSFRGIAQSDEQMALQGGFDVSHGSGLYAGVWGSNVDFNDGDEASVEVDVYGGYAGEVGGVGYDVGLIYYAYPGADSSLDYDFIEAALEISYDFEIFSVAASVNYSPEYFAGSGDAQYYALGVDVPLPHDFSLSGHVGRQEIDENDEFGTDDYTDWSIGLGYNFEGFDLSVQYIDTDLDEPDECADGCEDRVIMSVSKSF